MSHPQRCLGLDGKSYPSAWLHADDRAYLADRVHHFSHAERLSVRQIIARLAEDHGVRRSVGWVSGILRNWRCDGCSGVASPLENAAPEHPCGGAA